MKKYTLIVLLFFIGLRLEAETDLVIKNPSNFLHFKVNLNSKNLFKEEHNGLWVNIGKLEFTNIDLKELKILTNQSFKDRGNILVSLEGTGQLYRLDIKNLTFSRLDSTYFRGHNFSSIKFIRKDTLYSLGGSGFWHVHNMETIYSTKLHSWELLNAPDSEGPQQILRQYGGYDKQRDLVSVIESPPFYHKNVSAFTYKYFEKDLKTNAWEYLGDLNAELLFKLGLKSLKSDYVHGLYLFNTGDYKILGDPVKNKIYLIDKNLSLNTDLVELSEKNGVLYSYSRDNHFNNSQIILDSISIQKLKLLGVVKGDFYIRKSEISTLFFLVCILLIVLLCTGHYIWRKSNKTKRYSENTDLLEGMPEGTNDFLRLCLHYPIGHEFNSIQLTEFMGYHIYAYETQRQLRSKLIKSINSYFSIYFKMNDVIIRNTSNADKRYYIYRISEDHYDRLKEMLGMIIPR